MAPNESRQKKTGSPPEGLRERKKARRRGEILKCASTLFARQGIDATSMSEIADAVGISAPTVFNYFGSKDGILIAMITEGTRQARNKGYDHVLNRNTDFAHTIVDLFCLFAERTLKIAGKRIWRYAEAAAIRNPTTELARSYATVDRDLIQVVAAFFDRFEVRLLNGEAPDSEFLARLFFSAWNRAFFDLITIEDMGLDQHRSLLEARFVPLANLIFEKEFLMSPFETFKEGEQ